MSSEFFQIDVSSTADETEAGGDAAVSVCSARRAHPSQLRPGHFVSLQSVTYEYPTFAWGGCDPVTMPPEKPVRVTFTSPEQAEPMEVVSVCLPFVLCKLVDESSRMYDVRQVQFLQLTSDFARIARSALASKNDDKKSGKKSRSKKRKKGNRSKRK